MPRLCPRPVTAPNDRHRLFARHQVSDKGLVNLDLIDRKAAQITQAMNIRCRNHPGQRRSPLHATQKRLQSYLRWHPERPDSVISSSSRSGRSPDATSAVCTVSTRSRFLNWTGERFTATLMSSGQFSASKQAVCRTHSPIATIIPVSSASRDEVHGRDKAAVRVMPAQQCLKAGNLIGDQVDLRLIIEFELVRA